MQEPLLSAAPPALPPLPPLPARLATFAGWGALVGIAFFSIYPTMNWLTGLRTGQHALYLEAELALPFVPQFIWLYLSMYLLFAVPPFFLNPAELKRLARELIAGTLLSGLIFLLLPARLGFPRIVPDDPTLKTLYEGIFLLDQPFNLVPSLHVVYSAAIVFAVMARAGFGQRLFFAGWLALIAVSTLLVHQHHLLDVVAGLALASLMRFSWKE